MYELFDSQFHSLGTVADLIAPRGPDAVGMAKAYGGTCIVVRCADSVAIMAYGNKPGRLLHAWRSEMMPGVKRAVA